VYTLGDLKNRRYISLTTFKRDGTPVSTPVWVVSDDGERLLVWSAAKTWKVRRIQRDPRVLVAPSNFRGKERGERLEAAARVIAYPQIDELLRRKYGWQKRALDWLNRRGSGEWATIELSQPAPSLRPTLDRCPPAGRGRSGPS
jgi:PPOX class probable F420-dependent enzyme